MKIPLLSESLRSLVPKLFIEFPGCNCCVTGMNRSLSGKRTFTFWPIVKSHLTSKPLAWHVFVWRVWAALHDQGPSTESPASASGRETVCLRLLRLQEPSEGLGAESHGVKLTVFDWGGLIGVQHFFIKRPATGWTFYPTTLGQGAPTRSEA